MLEVILICIAAFLAAILTFFSGFGLGTILAPVFMIFFPVDLAIALTGVVHLFNNIFKIFLVGRNADLKVFIRFGIPAILAAALGALVLLNLPDKSILYSYSLMGTAYEVSPVQFVIAILLVIFALLDLIPVLQRVEFKEKHLVAGGLLSGFFGGLSGHQGALRSAFLIKSGLSKEAFIGTAVLVSTCVDFTRIGIYASRFLNAGMMEYMRLVLPAIASAISGAYIGNLLLKKVSLVFIRRTVAVLLLALSLALGLGWL